MKLVNKTKWRTDDLRAIIKRVIQQIEKYGFDATCRKRLRLTIVPARQQKGCSGYAYVFGRNARVMIPTKANELDAKIKIGFAHVIAHECAHIMGHIGERWMRAHPVWGRISREKYWSWAAEMPIRKQEIKTKRVPIETKISAIDLRLKKWRSKLKRAQTAIQKLSRSLKRYEKLALIAAQEPT